MDKTNFTGNKILFVINPGAGTGNHEGIEDTLQGLAGSAGLKPSALILGSGSRRSQVDESLKEFDPDIVVACGGDGTVNLVALAVMEKPVKIGIIPLGSSNGLAYELGIPGDPEQALRTVLNGKSRKMDILRINGHQYCLHISDVGANARVVKYFQRDNLRGLLGYAKHYIRILGKINKFSCTLQGDDRQSISDVLMVVLANASHYGTGAIINPEGRLDDGRFEVIVVRFSLARFVKQLLVQWFTGKAKEEESFLIVPATEEEIVIDPPQDLQVDGEPIGKVGRVRAEVLPGKIEILCSGEASL